MTVEKPTHKIVLVEDNQADLSLIRYLIDEVTEFNAEVYAVSSLTEGIREAHTHEPDVVFLDLTLPDSEGLDGLSMFEAAKLDVPIVILTSNQSVALQQGAIQRGAQDYLLKDNLTPQSISQSVRYALERHSYMKRLLETTQEKLRLEHQLANTRLMEKLVANIHHEFRTPLTTISMGLDLIRMNPRADALESNLNNCIHAVERLVKIGDYLSRLARLSSVDLEAEPYLSSQDIETILQQISVVDERVAVFVDHGFKVQIRAENLRLILKALIHNGLIYSDENAPVHVSATCVDDSVTISVQDEGIGIPSHEIDNIFQPFYKLAKARTRLNGDDAGTGLSVAQAIAVHYGGRIVVSSTVSLGSTFTVQLPASQ